MHLKVITLFTRFLFAASFCFATVGILAQEPCTEHEPVKLITKYGTRLSINISADLDQCANGSADDPSIQCAGKAWQNGNLCKNVAHYLEGESVPYRMKFDGLTPGTSYTVTIEWDTTESSAGKHALDYLTAFDETETTADPCSDVAGCVFSNKTTYAIPMDVHVAMGHDQIMGTGDDVVQKPGIFTLFSGTITGVSAYVMTGTYGGASQTSITLTLVPDVANPVLAWSGHISTRTDWGTNNSAIAINGSPYHMRLLDLNGSGGNQDRSLASDATTFPGTVTIVKNALPTSDQVFDFTVLGPDVSNFSLVDNGSGIGDIQTFAGLTQFGVANSVTITESSSTGLYRLATISCVESASGGAGEQNSTVNVFARYANIILEEGESVTCTFVNQLVTAAATTINGQVYDPSGMPIKASLTLTEASTGAVLKSITGPFGYYSFAGVEVGNVYILQVNAKGYSFAEDSVIIAVEDVMFDINFVGERSRF